MKSLRTTLLKSRTEQHGYPYSHQEMKNVTNKECLLRYTAPPGGVRITNNTNTYMAVGRASLRALKRGGESNSQAFSTVSKSHQTDNGFHRVMLDQLSCLAFHSNNTSP